MLFQKKRIYKLVLSKLILFIVSLTYISIAIAATKNLVLCDVCEGYTLSKKGDDLLIRCPNKTDPWMILANCKNPIAKKVGNKITITCDWSK